MKKRLISKAIAMDSCRQSINENALNQDRTEALIMARVLAMAGLPRTRTKARQMERILRLGADRWVKITYSTTGDELPFGQDRMILASIQHLAINPPDGVPSPIVRFKNAAEFLKTWNLADSRYYYERLREGFRRLSRLLINFEEADSEEALRDSDSGENLLIVRKYRFPSHRDLVLERAGQLSLPAIYEGENALYGVKLDEEFFQLLTSQFTRVIVPVELLRLYTDSPAKWDFALFLVARAGVPFCRSRSKIDHDTLVGLFRDGKERDRAVIERLKSYLHEFHLATGHRLNAKIIEDGFKPKKPGSRGRRSKKWAMMVEPGQKLVWSGKKVFPAEQVSEKGKGTVTLFDQHDQRALECLRVRKDRGVTPNEIDMDATWVEPALRNLVAYGFATFRDGRFYLV